MKKERVHKTIPWEFSFGIYSPVVLSSLGISLVRKAGWAWGVGGGELNPTETKHWQGFQPKEMCGLTVDTPVDKWQ